MILTPVFKDDFLVISQASDQRFLEARWTRQVSGEEFRRGMEAVMDSVASLGAELLLMDLRLAGVPSLSDQNWLVRRMISANKGFPLRRSARLLSRDLLQHMVSEVITEKVEAFPYRYEMFEGEERALQWLFREETR